MTRLRSESCPDALPLSSFPYFPLAEALLRYALLLTPSMRAFREEIFGPVAPVTTFQSDEEAVALASDSEYGLSLSIICSSLERSLALSKRIPAGLVHINDQNIGDEPFASFGGVGASGNGARHGGPANWEEFTQWQWVTLQARPPRYQF
jgi:benzaldehyde dehydrogenase (NAD)